MAKIWKKLLLFILIVACLFDVTIKLTKRNSLKNEIEATIKYFSNNDGTKIVNVPKENAGETSTSASNTADAEKDYSTIKIDLNKQKGKK